VSFSNSQTLNRYTQPTSISLKKEDTNIPFSFKDWFASHRSIIPSQEYAQYNEYLINWYKEKHSRSSDFSLNIKLQYLALLRQLQLFLSKEDVENWYNNIDFNSDKELLLATPFFAKKLRDISFYYSRLRETVKESRLRYNQTGTGFGITSQLQKHLLSEYTKRSTEGPVLIPSSIWNSIPELSSINNTIVIQLEELYDNHSYHDHSPTVPLSSYYDLNSSDIENFLTTKNLYLSSLNWIYSAGIFPLSAVDGSTEEESDINFYTNLLSRKYIGRDIFTATLPVSSDQKDFYTVTISEGTNFFFWPSFVYDSLAENLPLYQPQSLSSLNLETLGTAGSSIELADTIFIKSKNGISGAWLRSNIFNTYASNMEAILEASSKTSFRFPFPGFGLSGEDLEWTGFELSTNKKYKYLKEETRKSIENAYWSSGIDLSSSVPLKINDTSLVSNQAQPGKSLSHSDKLRYFEFTPNYGLESSADFFQETWLFKFTQTDIPLQAGADNLLIWPYERIDPEEPFPVYYPSNFSDVCETLSISSLDASFALASPSLSSSDVIYKIQNYQDSIEDATECCWLSSVYLEIPEEKVFTNFTDTLQLQVSPNSYARFIWTGPDYTDADKVFKSVSHSPECLYLNDVTNTYKNAEKCSCRSVLFSPFGHPGEKYTNYESLADFIVEDDNPLEPLDLSVKNLSLSSFGWFKTNNQVGWGDGIWYTNSTNNGNTFYLRKNRKYLYYRTGSKKDDSVLPSYTVRYSYGSSTNKTWIRAKKDTEGNWISTSQPSQMSISPGDLLIYQRRSTSNYLLSGTIEEIVDLSENRGSIWTNIDYLTPRVDKPVIVGYPTFGYTTNTDPQYPAISFANILQVLQWSLSAPGQPIQYFKSSPSFTFIPTLTGIYTIGLTALSGDPDSIITGVDSAGNFSISYGISGIYIFNNVPQITAVSNISLVPSYSSVEIPVPGYVLNTPLDGWDYNIGAPNPYALIADKGAQPFWAKVYYDQPEFSGYPGVETPQRFFDEHNVITQPQISDIVLEMGSRIDYYRNYPTRLKWTQPLTLISSTDDSSWCSLDISLTASNIQEILNTYKEELIVKSTTTPSTLSLINRIDNEPVEVYYNAQNFFVWNITAIPQKNLTSYIEPSSFLAIDAIMPYANLANDNFPTFAVFPAIENLYSKFQTGGYFIPSNFGASKYLNKNYTLGLNASSSTLSAFFNETEKLGLSQQLQNSPYEILIEDSSWLKEPLNSNALAGSVNKEVYKTHQKFIPYQSSSEINPLVQAGIIDTHTLQDPWNEKEMPKWIDSNNYPITFEGELNISSWTESQIQFTGLYMDQWVSDIFGNQYGLYKNINLSASIPEKREAYGQIWVKDNAQRILPASKALSGVFDIYKETSLIGELTGLGIKKIDMFFDTLMIETSSILFFEKLNYDFVQDQIYSIADNSRRLSLLLAPAPFILLEPYLNGGNLTEGFLIQENGLGILTEDTIINIKFGETWFFPVEKKVIVSVAATYNDIIFPELYEINLQDMTFKKIFPLNPSDIIDVVSLSSYEFITNERPNLSYNSLKKEYLLVISYSTRTNQHGILELTIDDKDVLSLNTIKIFQSIPYEAHLPYISQTLKTTISNFGILNFVCMVDNGPAVFEETSLPSWVSLTNNGIFSGTPTSSGNYFAEFKVTNDQGTSYYSLNIEVI